MKYKITFWITLILMITLLPAGTAHADSRYTVQPGDILSRIAAQHNTTVEAIVQANGLDNPNLIYVGQVLIIPGPGGPVSSSGGTTTGGTTSSGTTGGTTSAPTASGGTYTVVAGDNLYRIAIRNGTSVDELMRVNNLTSTVILIGQVLKLPGGSGSTSGGSTSGSAGNTAPAPTATAPPASAPAPSAPVVSAGAGGGFGLGGQVAGFGEQAESAMHSAGMTWVKRQVVWGPGANANDFVALIHDAHARGFQILLSVKGHPPDTDPAHFAEFAQFAAQLAAAGADGIEIWNEANIDREWAAGQISPATYTSMLQQAYNAIKTANPGTMVISGAPAPTGYFGGCSPNGCDDAQYIAGMVGAGALNYTDCIGIHYNEGLVSPTQSFGDPRGNSGHYTRYYQTMVDTYYGLGGGRRPLCFTELGYLSGQEWGYLPSGFLWRPPYNLTVDEQARFLGEAVALSRSQGKVRLMIVFNVDFTTWGSDPQAGYAIIRPGGGCPACAAMAGAMQ